MPPLYVENQRTYNSLHRDGTREAFIEDAELVARNMCKFVKDNPRLPHSSFLVIGCRMGYEMVVLQEMFPSAEVGGIDVVPEFVELAQEAAPATLMDMHEMSYKDKTFDWILCTQTLEHAYNIRKAIDEMFRVAKVGVCIGVPLEGKISFTGNPSHYGHTTNPYAWIDQFKHAVDAWVLYHLYYCHRDTYQEMTFINRDYLDSYLSESSK